MNLYDLVAEYKTNPLGIDVRRPRLSWKMVASENNVLQDAYRIQVAASAEELAAEASLLWDSGDVESSQSIHIEYAGEELKSGERVYWRVKVWAGDVESEWSDGSDFWEMGLLDSGDWKAEWISTPVEDDLSKACPVPMFRKEFEATKGIASARVYATSLGIYELRINGERIGDALFTPGWTSYNKRLQYQTYDVTDLLNENSNAIGATVGDGWFRGHLAGWADPNRNHYGNELALLLQLELEYEDGSKETITTDSSWKNSTGPIRAADFYMGESYDARLEKQGWDMPGYNDLEWIDVKLLDHSKDMLIAQAGPPVRRMFEIKPVEILTTPEGDTVIDMGQNMVGWVRFTIRGREGQSVKLRHAEVLDKEGNFYIANLKGAKQEVSYTFAEEGEITFEPHFTFQGFRYFTVEGLDYTPSLEDFIGEVIYSDIPLAGSFTCSDPLINKLQENIQWGQRGNFVDVPTDCPQRQERLGWSGDAQVFAPTAAFNMDVASFFTKWMADVAADQREDGSVPHIVPFLDVLGEGGYGSAAWADVAAVVPYTIYQYYGDTRILENQYKSMKGWVEFMRKEAGDGYLYNTGFHYGDWLAYASDNSDYPGATTDKDIISSAYFAYSTSILVKTAEILGKAKDVRFYSGLLEKIKVAFDDEFISRNGRVGSNTQTAYALALAFDLVPEEKEAQAAARYASDIRKFGHITTGFVGTPLVCLVLSKYGYNEEAFNLLTRKEYPSWLYPVTKGATTIWERWDGIKPDGSFNTKPAFADAGDEDMMNSFNHYAYGAIGDWMYKVVAGIDFGEAGAGFKKIVIKPVIAGGLTNASATHESMYGTISSSWRIDGGQVVLEVEIPPNTTAEVFAPDIDGEYEKHEIGSGKYTFTR
ncbi:MAG: glycoside hydrolase family 78 protein [Verrucomicrobiota bacterium]